jgi:hypothetical protein
MNPYDEPEAAPRGMSSGSKVLLGFGIGCGVFLLLCCGSLVILIVWAVNYFGNAVTEDPAAVRRLAADIIKIEIPEELEPRGGMDLRIPFVGDRLMSLVVFGSNTSDDHLFMAEFGGFMADAGDLEGQMRDSIDDNWQEHHEDVEVLESETHELKIHDQDASFHVAKAKGRESDKEYWEVMGEFRGESGPAVMVLRLGAEEFTKEQVIEILDSMK